MTPSSALMLLLTGLTMFAAAGCQSLPQDRLDQREYRQVDFEQRFRADRRRCLARGGTLYIAASRSVDRKGTPARGDRYVCG